MLALLAPQGASAHFLWMVTEPNAEPAKVKVYFGEAPEPDDPDLLARVQAAKVWVMGGRQSEPKLLELSPNDGALEAVLDRGAAQNSLVLRHNYGVITRGDSTFLLNYYARTYPSALPGTWRSVRDAERLPLEITPRIVGKEVVLRIEWKGEPVPGAAVAVQGPGADVEGETDASGDFRFAATESGQYAVRARHVESEQGEHDGKSYTERRHYSTVVLDVQPAQVSPVAHDLPPLPQGTTSIGAAIANDTLYVYGGNYGDAHDYSSEGQSGDLWKLDLKNPAAWQQAAGGPKLQGLALVEHQQQLYRVGGFSAANAEGEDEDLRSQASFARFDPVKNAWEELAPLPEPRSSHDAAIVDGVLYVVGGWALRGRGNDPQWHDTAWALDLKQEGSQWKPLATPTFKRRALALAAHQGKLYCLGGMKETGGPTREVSIYDPAADRWTEGPTLLGEGMDGFGASAFACADALYVTTISGSIQRLSADGAQWQYVGQLEYPRFFHRLLAWNNDKLLVVAGGSMSIGKVEDLEVVPVTAAENTKP